MLIKICTSERKHHMLFVQSFAEFVDRVKALLKLEEDFHCVMEEDGCSIGNDVIEAILEAREKIGTIMVLANQEQWSKAKDSSLVTESNESADVSAGATASVQAASNGSGARTQSLITAAKKMFQDVRTVLEKNPKGQKVQVEYQQNQTLSAESRQVLVKIAVAQLVQDCGSYPTKENKIELAAGIVRCMPGLKDTAGITGYEHFFSELNGQTGYIQDRLKRIRRKLAPEEQQRPRKRTAKEAGIIEKTPGDCDLPVGQEAAVDLNEAEVNAVRLDCLYANPVTDKAVILSGMAKTAAARQHWIRTSHPSITEVINQYPRMEDMPLDMLDIDFRVHFPNALGKFARHFPEITRGVLAAARLSRKTDIVELLREYDFQQHSAELRPRDHLYAVLSLLHLLPSANTRHNAKRSSSEVQRSLIAFCPQGMRLDVLIHETRPASHKQPFLVCLGTKEEQSTFFLAVDSKMLNLGDCGILVALDALFKAHFVFWVDYAKCLSNFYDFIQKEVYGIDSEKKSARVRELCMAIHTFIKNSAASVSAD